MRIEFDELAGEMENVTVSDAADTAGIKYTKTCDPNTAPPTPNGCPTVPSKIGVFPWESDITPPVTPKRKTQWHKTKIL